MTMDEELSKALDSLSRYLALRDHSEKELRQKLSRRYSPAVIEKTIEFAHDHALLLPPEELAEKTTASFGRKKKSHNYIQNMLRRKGLPSTPKNSEGEMEKMRRLLSQKFGSLSELNYEEKTKAYRFLKYRGFDDQLIRKVIHEK